MDHHSPALTPPRHRTRRPFRGRIFAAVALAGALIAASCGGSESEGTDDTTTTTANGDGAPTTVVVSTTEPPATGPDMGGRLVYAVEADSANGWAHYRVSCAISCYRILGLISDPLFASNVDGEVSGILVESWESNDDYTEWTFTVREGITFHDGTPLDGAAVKVNIDACRGSSLSGPALSNIINTTADGQSITFTMATPWAPFPFNMAGGQC